MKNMREHIYLAALLHDIGKFYQRADRLFNEKHSELSEHSKKLAEEICPINDYSHFGYQHVVWTNEFFEKNKIVFKNIPELRSNLNATSNHDCIENLACNHHSPNTISQAIITMADWWSAGIDRRKAVEHDETTAKYKNINWGNNRHKKIPLYSIFNSIHGQESNFAFPLTPLSLSAKLLPKPIVNLEEGNNQNLYNSLWSQFTNEFSKLPSDNIKGFTESLLYLLKKYTWCIPSNTVDMANVSLFDHLKTTAAFADCLYCYQNEYPNDFIWNDLGKNLTIKKGVLPVILLGCDLSGIQKFIYNVSSRKAASSLKGRSFYLQLMIDSTIQKIISHSDIKASAGHVVYSSGGKFYMLLPNTDKVKVAIENIKDEIEKEVWAEQKGSLIVNLAYVPFAYVNNKNEIIFDGTTNQSDLGALWKTLADKLTEEKNIKFKNVLVNSFDEIFNPASSGGKVKVCAVTGIELKANETKKIPNSETVISNAVHHQITLGETLKDVDYIITCKDKVELSSYLSSRSKANSTIFGITNYLFDKKELINNEADFRKIKTADVSRVKRINNVDFTAAPIKGENVSYGFQFYGGNEQAQNLKEKRDQTFEELTRTENKESETYFGVLRMDVDGLGEIFIKGIPEESKTFSAYATLSSHLDWFFSGYLNTIRNKYSENVNILYSGGDDVFAVGRWDKLLSFAEDVRVEFRKFVGREDISISAGLVLVGNKYPIAKAAELAGEAEHKAKKFNNAEKNAINIFGKNLSWDKEFEYVKDFKNQFTYLISKHKMSHSILHKLMQLSEIMSIGDMSYLWNTAYFLKRFSEGKEKEGEIKDFCLKTLQKELLDKRNYELIAIAARWAELEIKELTNKL